GMIQQYFQGEERGRAFGYFGTTVGVSLGVGPVLGGLLINFAGTDLGWRLTFLMNVPIGMLTIILGLMWFPRPLIKLLRVTSYYATLRSLDPIGALIFTLGVLCVLLPFMGNQSLFILLLPSSFLLFQLWVKWEKYYSSLGYEPMVDLNIFRSSNYTNGVLIMSLYFLGKTSIWLLIALYMQQGVGKSAFETSLVGIPGALLTAYASNWAGKRVTYFGRKIVVAGLSFTIFSLLLSIGFILLHELYQFSIWWLLFSLAFFGLGQGATTSPNQAITLADVPVAYAGSSGAIMQTAQRVGASVGIAVITAITFTTVNYFSWTVAIIMGFITIILIITLALLVAVKDLK
ncbi:MAG TPA: MFS transporter, partial [Tissierellaceae bacterium]|nr:MFS transporter [Tissierellaceae bacterium]